MQRLDRDVASGKQVEKILAREAAQGTPVDAILPTLGGQTGLNTGMACYDQGILARYNVKMIGADRDAIHRGGFCGQVKHQ